MLAFYTTVVCFAAALDRGQVREPEAGAAGHLPESPHQPAGTGAPGLSLPVGKARSCPAQPGVGRRHRLLAHGPGVLYLVDIMDWHSRYVVAWRLSTTLEADFCVDALREALGQGRPEVFNTDQGSQFTSLEFTQVLQEHGVKISMDGKGWYNDNIFVERLWRTVNTRRGVPESLRQRHRSPQGTERLPPVLQRPEAPSGPGLPDPGGGVPRGQECHGG